MYTDAVAGMNLHMVRRGGVAKCSNCTYIGKWNYLTGGYVDKMDHLVRLFYYEYEYEVIYILFVYILFIYCVYIYLCMYIYIYIYIGKWNYLTDGYVDKMDHLVRSSILFIYV